jgi:hypothetical protein
MRHQKPKVGMLACMKMCDQCDLDAVVTCAASGENYCEYHSPVDVVLPRPSVRDEHVKAVKLMTSMRFDAGLCGEVTSGPLPTEGSRVPLPRIDGAVTIVLQGLKPWEKHGIRRMPELCIANMGPVMMHDGRTVWSNVLSNGIQSLRWYAGVQSAAESDAMGALMRCDCAAYSHKSMYPGFPETANIATTRSVVRFAPLFDATRDDVVIFDAGVSELVWSGAELTRIEARALFCALYARLAEPLLYSLRRRILEGVSFHVAGGFTFTEEADTHFGDIAGCSFKEESCVVCLLRGLAPWDDYIRARFAAAADGTDTHPVFTALIALFFGERYKQPCTV